MAFDQSEIKRLLTYLEMYHIVHLRTWLDGTDYKHRESYSTMKK